MQKHDNDSESIDRFFQKALKRPDISYNEGDWERLKARLDSKAVRTSTVRSNRVKLGAYSVAAIALVSSLLYLNQMSSTEIAKIQSQGKKTADSREMLSTGKETVQPSSPEIEINRTPSEANETERASIAAPSRGSTRPGRSGTATLTSRQLMTTVQGTATQDQGIGFAVEGDQTAGEEIPGKLLHEAQEPSTMTPDEEKSREQPTDIISERVPVAIPEDAKDETHSKRKYGEKGFSLRASVAPDLTAIGMSRYSGMGEAFGIKAFYHMNRLSFSAGLVRSNKVYKAEGEQYHPPKGYWKYYTNDVVPESIDGACSVLEIPVMVQYMVVGREKSRITLGAGASSYVMLKESYNYNFEQPNPGAKDGWESSKRSTHFIGVVNFNLSYERDILPRLALGIEPYLKVPATGIGWSNLKLHSAGASLTARYRLSKGMRAQSPTTQ